MHNDRRRQLGALGEQLAAEHLARRGMRILARNFHTRHGELDIVAADATTLVFCEVKTRLPTPTGRDPLESVHLRKRTQVRRMAAVWLATQTAGRPRPPELRFDAIGVTVTPDGQLLRLDHVEGAF
ncbi:MAG: YraN family protein [Solirubrobacteraceae bacterium]